MTLDEKWQPIETAPEFSTVLTQHVEDIYPQPAFQAGDHWLREAEGPEDTCDRRPGKYGPLYRTPTHWMPLPEGPLSHEHRFVTDEEGAVHGCRCGAAWSFPMPTDGGLSEPGGERGSR